jgi:hypothetical protein
MDEMDTILTGCMQLVREMCLRLHRLTHPDIMYTYWLWIVIAQAELSGFYTIFTSLFKTCDFMIIEMKRYRNQKN